ncbi:MAG: hypothetical protein J3K34DRAFT_416160 [Monoraphidium minutum]|nr:MAG: hypothetical protein J3K34DRAFT_416160 [Monoraphidium minutum]
MLALQQRAFAGRPRAFTALRGPRLLTPQRAQTLRVRGIGSDATNAWLDLAKLVASDGGKKGPYDDLAYKIGRDVYVDIAGWHLFLRDMAAVPGLKMAAALAGQLGPAAAGAGRGGLRESDVSGVLKRIPVDVGGGRVTLSLYDVMPSGCVSDLVRLLEDWAKDQ